MYVEPCGDSGRVAADDPCSIAAMGKRSLARKANSLGGGVNTCRATRGPTSRPTARQSVARLRWIEIAHEPVRVSADEEVIALACDGVPLHVRFAILEDVA